MLHFFSGDKFANARAVYHYNSTTKLFTAELKVNEEVNCTPNPCINKMIPNLKECENINVSISHDTCGAPEKILELYVPPGKYQCF